MSSPSAHKGRRSDPSRASFRRARRTRSLSARRAAPPPLRATGRRWRRRPPAHRPRRSGTAGSSRRDSIFRHRRTTARCSPGNGAVSRSSCRDNGYFRFRNKLKQHPFHSGPAGPLSARRRGRGPRGSARPCPAGGWLRAIRRDEQPKRRPGRHGPPADNPKCTHRKGRADKEQHQDHAPPRDCGQLRRPGRDGRNGAAQQRGQQKQADEPGRGDPGPATLRGAARARRLPPPRGAGRWRASAARSRASATASRRRRSAGPSVHSSVRPRPPRKCHGWPRPPEGRTGPGSDDQWPAIGKM